ncbi:MAG TPA: type VI secretion system baseplate subunit TssE [Acetobacteraceae bacterium]|jgi:type VI secretion system protein ImpF|nr:type VI secretion system baseplate subunit TssE [Acetobacteraceae bacterium]
MSGLKGRERLQPSLLDRLTDKNPSAKRDRPDEQVLTLAQLRQAVLRDLAALLNTSNLTSIAELEDAPLACKSTLNYGIPGFSGLLDTSERVRSLEEELVTAIRTYEPRIRSETVKVRSRGALEASGVPALLFEIEGELWAQPVPQQLFLETKIEVETRLAVVTETKGSH